MAFLFFSLPIFWVAVLLKEFGAIGFNNFLANPEIPSRPIAPRASVAGASSGVDDAVGGEMKRCCSSAASRSSRAAVLLIYFSATDGSTTPAWARWHRPARRVGIAFAVIPCCPRASRTARRCTPLIAVGRRTGVYFRSSSLCYRADPVTPCSARRRARSRSGWASAS